MINHNTLNVLHTRQDHSSYNCLIYDQDYGLLRLTLCCLVDGYKHFIEKCCHTCLQNNMASCFRRLKSLPQFLIPLPAEVPSFCLHCMILSYRQILEPLLDWRKRSGHQKQDWPTYRQTLLFKKGGHIDRLCLASCDRSIKITVMRDVTFLVWWLGTSVLKEPAGGNIM